MNGMESVAFKDSIVFVRRILGIRVVEHRDGTFSLSLGMGCNLRERPFTRRMSRRDAKMVLKGLKSKSALEVARVIQEQINLLESN